MPPIQFPLASLFPFVIFFLMRINLDLFYNVWMFRCQICCFSSVHLTVFFIIHIFSFIVSFQNFFNFYVLYVRLQTSIPIPFILNITCFRLSSKLLHNFPFRKIIILIVRLYLNLLFFRTIFVILQDSICCFFSNSYVVFYPYLQKYLSFHTPRTFYIFLSFFNTFGRL